MTDKLEAITTGDVGGPEIAALRMSLGLTQEAFGRLLGWARPTVSRIERGARFGSPHFSRAVRMLWFIAKVAHPEQAIPPFPGDAGLCATDGALSRVGVCVDTAVDCIDNTSER